MPKHLRSFLIRCWDLSGGEQRIEIEHIQSGKRIVAKSMANVVALMSDPDAGDWVAPMPVAGNALSRAEDELTEKEEPM